MALWPGILGRDPGTAAFVFLIPGVSNQESVDHRLQMGVATVTKKGGNHAVLLAKRVTEYATYPVGREQLLGYTMAHELGHLLSLRHSQTGIMRASWSHNDMWAMSQGRLCFMPSEGTQMRAAIEQRTKQ